MTSNSPHASQPLTSGQTGEARSPLEDKDWEKLIKLLREKRIIPVIGPDLLAIPWNDNPAAKLYELWGKELAEYYQMNCENETSDTPLLYWVSDQLFLKADMPVGDLEYELSNIICDEKWPVPQSLLQLAEIRDFPLYISTTIDHLMESALRLKRGGSENIVFCRTGGAKNDLPGNFAPTPEPHLIQLFGASCADSEAFAVTEDDLIEFSWSLIDHDYSPKNLYSYLQRRQLLLLGCDFPDWLDRFFIHALSHDQGSQVGITFVSERCPKGLQEFLRRKKARPFIKCSPVDFVAELYQRWQKYVTVHAAAAGPAKLPGGSPEASPGIQPSKAGSVFISYARDDRAQAIAIRDQLEAANIDTWMDDKGLDPGEAYDEAIHENIRNASFFVALISKSLNLEQSNRNRRYVLKEWRWAEDADLERPRNQNFLQPVVLDDTLPGAPFIEGPMRMRQWTECTNGQLPERFIDFLRQGIRRYRAQ
jgi:hypothetical protein